jgi:hypothetical protein
MKRLVAAAVGLLAPVIVAHANDFETLERVDYVLTCMKREGGQTVDNLYACSCEIDAIAAQMPFEEYNDSRTWETYRKMPGEKGEMFRESKGGKQAAEKLDTLRKEARKRCFVGRPAPAANP